MNYATWLAFFLIGIQTTVTAGTFFKGTTFVNRVSPLIFLSRTYTQNNMRDPIISPSTVRQEIAGKLPVKVQEFINVLRYSEKYKKIGSIPPKGLLLAGPSGVGKTAIVRFMAAELGCLVLPVNSAELRSESGMGVERIQYIFEAAGKMSSIHGKSLIFFDEIDIIGSKRSSDQFFELDNSNSTLTELLVQMDGFKVNPGVFVVGATNRKDILDPALLRPGRFEFIAHVPFPDEEDRYAIVQLYLQKMRHKVSNPVIQQVVTTTQGLSADHLKSLVNLSGIKAVRAGKEIIEDQHFLHAADDICKQSGLNQDLSKHIL